MNPDILLFIPLIRETLDSTGIEWREVAITIRHEFRYPFPYPPYKGNSFSKGFEWRKVAIAIRHECKFCIILFIPLIRSKRILRHNSFSFEWREVAITIRHEFRNKKLLTRICNIILIKHVFFSIPPNIIVKYLLMQGV